MNFKVGDEVLIIKFIGNPLPKLLGKIGVITNIDLNTNKYPIGVTVDNDASWYSFDEKELIPATKTAKILYGVNNE